MMTLANLELGGLKKRIRQVGAMELESVGDDSTAEAGERTIYLSVW